MYGALKLSHLLKTNKVIQELRFASAHCHCPRFRLLCQQLHAAPTYSEEAEGVLLCCVFCSVPENKLGDIGATAIANALTENQTLLAVE